MGEVDRKSYSESIILTGAWPEQYKGQKMGTIYFEEIIEINGGKTYTEGKWYWGGGPDSLDIGSFKWERVEVPTSDNKSFLRVAIFFDNLFWNGEIHHSAWGQVRPPDRPWFRDNKQISGTAYQILTGVTYEFVAKLKR